MRRLVLALPFLCALGCGARSALLGLGDDEFVPPDDGSSGSSDYEICNGVDDDGDGEVDEDLGTTSCGLGSCRVEVPACTSGEPVACAPKPGSTEICNGVDDDCDGAVDEGLGLEVIGGPYTISYDEVAHPGLYTTVDGFSVAVGEVGDYSNPDPAVQSFDQAFDPDLVTNQQPQKLVGVPAELTGFRVALGEGDVPMLTYCAGPPSGRHPGIAAEGPEGVLRVLDLPALNAMRCEKEVPDILRTEDRLIVATLDEDTFAVSLDVLALDGTPIEHREVAQGASPYSPPRLARRGDRVLLIHAQNHKDHTRLAVHRLDAEAHSIEPMRELRAPWPAFNWDEAAVAGGGNGGFLVFSAGPPTGAIRVRFDDEGVPLEEPEIVGDATVKSQEMVADPGGGFVHVAFLSDTYEIVITRLDSDGVETDRWTSADDAAFLDEQIDGLSRAALAVAHGRIAAAFNSLSFNNGTNVEIATFSCRP